MRNAIAIGLLVLAFGCEPAPARTCDVPDRHVCLDYVSGFSDAEAAADCSTRWMGELSTTTLCTGVDRVARCTITCDSLVQIVYFYAPITSVDAEQECVAPTDSNCTYDFTREGSLTSGPP